MVLGRKVDLVGTAGRLPAQQSCVRRRLVEVEKLARCHLHWKKINSSETTLFKELASSSSV